MTAPIRKQHHIVYIPGLGDSNPRGQRLVVALWRNYGVHGHCFPLGWGDGETFEPKLKRLLEYIDSLLANGYTVSLVGSSAGAGAALHAYAKRKNQIDAVALLCGKINNPQTIHDEVFKKNPAFKESLERLPKTLKALQQSERERIISIHPVRDDVVPIADTYIKGARMRMVMSFGHSTTIGLLLTFDAFIPLWFLDRWTRRRSAD